MGRERAWHGCKSAPRGAGHAKEAGTAAKGMMAGTEAVTANADQQNKEKKVHAWMKATRLLR